MNEMQQGIIALLKSAITGEPYPLPDDFDLAAIYPQVKKHHMDALLYEGAVCCGIPRENPVMQELFRRYCRSLLISEGQMSEVRRIFDAFDKSGIDYLPLKGVVMKPRYPKPELRAMGDADILIRLEQKPKIDEILEDLGFAFKMETDHELAWTSKKLYLELHKHLIPSYNKDLFPHFGTGWQLARHEKMGLHTMSAEDEFLFLFTHFAKHFRDGGIGCRYMVDLWVFFRSFPQLDLNQVEKKLESLQLLEFYSNIRTLTDHWFENGPENDRTNLLTDYIFDSGSWGTGESKVLSRTVRDSKPGISGRLVYLWKTAFPPLQDLREKYWVLQKCPALLPLVWLIRPFYKVFFEFRTLKTQKQNLAALSPTNLRDRQSFLRHVGLDYRF